MAAGLDETRGAQDEPSTAEPPQRPPPVVAMRAGSQRYRPRRPGRQNTVPDKGTLVGRYVMISRLGSGAMGVVLAAYDPQLDRKVALKLLRIRGLDRAAARARLQREAQALARLNHPNVVSVHDVGMHEDRVFVAMEFVAGQTLQRWCGDAPEGGPRPWPQVLEVFEAAGRGLRAAHAEGLVHRDFKPDNVMIGDDGRVRVMDFGLARTTGTETEERRELSELDAVVEASGSSLRVDLTNPGALMGTPAYMAPEQFMGGEADARSDQFSYCVALYEALYGERPYEGDTVETLAYAAASQERAAPSRRAAVPSWLRAVVLRGLSPDPHERYRSMDELLAALGAVETRRRRRWWWIGGGVAVAVVASVVGVSRYDQVRREAACRVQGDAIEEVWSDDTRAALRDGLLSTGVSYAPEVAERVSPWVDEYAEAWRRHTTDACMNATVHDSWTAGQYDKAQWCLEERRQQLSTLVRSLAEAEAKDVSRAVQNASRLPALSTCVDEGALVALPEPPTPEVRDEVDEVRRQQAQINYFMTTGRYEESRALASTAQERAQALSWPPLVASTSMMLAKVISRGTDLARAEALGTEAYMEAVRANDWSTAADAATEMAYLVGVNLARPSEGRLWVELAMTSLEKVGDPGALREASCLNVLGNIEMARREPERARPHFERMMAIWQGYDASHPSMATALNNLGNTYFVEGKHEQAKGLYERALAIREQVLGPSHPLVGSLQTNIGAVHVSLGDHERAKELFERALVVLEGAHGPTHPEVAATRVNLASVYFAREEFEPARASYEQALSSMESVLGAENPKTMTPLYGLGRTLFFMGDFEAASPVLERVLTFESTPGIDPAMIANARFLLAQAIWEASPKPSERARALELAHQAAEASEGTALAEVEDWLAEVSESPASAP